MEVKVRWYYKPEDTIHGRKIFHGANELLFSNHCDTGSADAIEGKCIVHSYRDYTKLKVVDDEDYFSRSNYDDLRDHPPEHPPPCDPQPSSA